MTNTPYDLIRYIKTMNVATCSRCGSERIIEGERTRYIVAEYLIKRGWTASDDEMICPQCTQTPHHQAGAGGG